MKMKASVYDKNSDRHQYTNTKIFPLLKAYALIYRSITLRTLDLGSPTSFHVAPRCFQ